MVTSPSSSPPPKWISNPQGGGVGAGSGQLLQELEALSQSLYQAQKKSISSQSYSSQSPPLPQPPSQLQAPPAKRHSFLSRRETLGRRLSHDTSKDVSSKEPIPLSSTPAHDPPPSFKNLLSRHSLSTVQASSSLEQQKPGSANSRPRYSSSVVSSQNSSAWGEEKTDVRSRMDRRLSLQPLPAKNSDKSTPQEPTDWHDDPLESSRRFDSASSDKKKSVWSSWKPLRALSHIGRQRLHCVFSAYVHAIEGLPPAMNGLRLCVHMRKEETKEGAVQTMPSRVFQGIAEFQETLFMKCTLYGNKGPSNSMKFMAKAFIVSVIAPDIDELDFGRHQLDLSRLLGDLMDDRKGQLEKGNSWDTTLDLSGKAKGGRLAITFNYEILDKDSTFSGNVSSRFRESPPHRSSMHSSFSLPNSAHGTPRTITTRAHLSHSPSASEPGNDYDDLLAMDQLNLDEPHHVSGGDFEARAGQAGGQVAEMQGFPVFSSQPDRPPTASQSAFDAFPSVDQKPKSLLQTNEFPAVSMPPQSMVIGNTPRLPEFIEEDGHFSEDEADFVVVDQGMEIDDSAEKQADVIVEKEMYGAEEDTSDDLIPQVVEMDAMDDMPQLIDIKALDDLAPEAEMDAFDDLTPHVVEMESLDDPTPEVDEMEAFDDLHPQQGLDDLTPQLLGKPELQPLQGHENDDERPVREVFDGEVQHTEEISVVENIVDDKELHEDVVKNVTVDEGERKDTVTYLTVMQTLDSLLQGTSAKEVLQDEEKVELESSVDGIFSDEEDTTDKEVPNGFSPSSQEIDSSKNSVMDLDTDVHVISKNLKEESDYEDTEEDECGSKDDKEVEMSNNDVDGFSVLGEEEGGTNFSEENERGNKAFEEEERNVHVFEEEESNVHVFEEEEIGKKDFEEDETDAHVCEEEETAAHGLEEEERGNNDFKEDERGVQIFEEEERCNHALEEEQRGTYVSEEEEKGNSALEEQEIYINIYESQERGYMDAQEEERGSDVAVEGRSNNVVIDEENESSVVSEEEQGRNIITEVEKGSNTFVKEEMSDKNIDRFNIFDESGFSDVGEDERGNKGTNLDTESFQERTYGEVDRISDEDIDSEVDLVAGEFLDMLGMANTPETKNYDSEVDSPRARLLKQFEEEAFLVGGFGLDLEVPEFSLDGPPTHEEVGGLHTIVFHKSDVLDKDKEHATGDNSSVLMERGSEVDKWHHTSFLKMMDEEPDKWENKSALGEVEKEPANWDENLTMDKEHANRDHSSILMDRDSDVDKRHQSSFLKMMDKEPDKWEKKLALEEILKEPADWDESLAFKKIDKEPAIWDHNLASKGLKKDPTKWDHVIDSKGMDKALAKWDHIIDSKGMDKEPANCETSSLKGMGSKSMDIGQADWEHTLALKGMDKELVSQDHTLLLKEIEREPATDPAVWHHVSSLKVSEKEPAICNNTLALSGIDKEPANQDCAFALELKEKRPGHWVHAEKTDKEPANWGPESPPEAEKDPFNLDIEDDEDLMSIMEAAESELQRATQSMRSKTRAKMLEDAETEALMQEWGLNEKAFVSSPPKPTMRQQEPPPLGKGLGSAVPLKDGSSLRSMNPSHFQANKSSGKLVMQISKPVVVPAEMGSETVDILRNMASMGVENMALQAMTAMPLEDITGRSVEQVASEGKMAPKPGHRLLEGSVGSRKELSRNDRKSRPSQNSVDDFVTLEDIAPMAMQQIEALAMDGLKIQSDVADDDAPFTLNAFSLDGEPGGKDLSAGSAIVKGITGVHLSKGARASTETSGDGSNGPMGMAISLDEWMLLDAGLYDEIETSKDTLAIMAAHHAAHQELVVAGGGEDDKRKKKQGAKNTGARWGCMGNTLTIAMLVQLRDPLKNNEAVGAPMMAFVQAERMMKPPKMKVGRNVSMKGNSEDEEAGSGSGEPEFKITGVHMAGLKPSEEEKKAGWGNQKQLQSGSRWLIANGMSKNAKVQARPMLASKPSVNAPASSAKASNASTGESLWSLSTRALSSGLKWKDKLKLNSHARNPDIITRSK